MKPSSWVICKCGHVSLLPPSPLLSSIRVDLDDIVVIILLCLPEIILVQHGRVDNLVLWRRGRRGRGSSSRRHSSRHRCRSGICLTQCVPAPKIRPRIRLFLLCSTRLGRCGGWRDARLAFTFARQTVALALKRLRWLRRLVGKFRLWGFGRIVWDIVVAEEEFASGQDKRSWHFAICIVQGLGGDDSWPAANKRSSTAIAKVLLTLDG